MLLLEIISEMQIMISLINKSLTSKVNKLSLIGKTVRCNRYVLFADGTEHTVGSLHKITEENESYYQLFLNKGYRLVLNVLVDK